MKISRIVVLGTILILGGCASYTTPGGSVQLSELAETDINELMSKEPAANFPANISIARVQAPGYQSYKVGSFGTGRYSVVTTREVESEEDFKRLSSHWGTTAPRDPRTIMLGGKDSIPGILGCCTHEAATRNTQKTQPPTR